MKERLIHILDDTACLNRKQMKDYLSGSMLPEEILAAEAHISSCPLCSIALEGFQEQTEEALQAIATLDSGFLKQHFDSITPQIHLNSLAPAAVGGAASRKKKSSSTIPLNRIIGIAAVLLFGFGLFWFYKLQEKKSSGLIAQREVAPPPSNLQAPGTVRIGDSVMLQPTSISETYTAALDSPVPIITQSKSAAASQTPAANGEIGTSVAPVRREQLADALSAEVSSPPAPTPKTRAMVQKDKLGADRDAEKSKAEDQKAKKSVGSLAPSAAQNARSVSTDDATPVVNDVKEDDFLKRGDEYFGAGKYNEALKKYKAEMASGTEVRKSKASVMAARCYLNLGQKAKARELLQKVVDNGAGQQRRQAKRLLRGIDE